MVCSDKSDPDLSHFLSGILILESTSIDYSLIKIYESRYIFTTVTFVQFSALFIENYQSTNVTGTVTKSQGRQNSQNYIENYLSYDNISRTLLFGQSPLHFLRLSFADA